jgi:hypothetical protein
VLYAISASWPGPGLAWPDLAWPDLAWLYFFFGVPFMVPFVSPPFPLPLEFGARASLSSWQTFLLVLGPSQSLFFIISESENQPWMIKVYDSFDISILSSILRHSNYPTISLQLCYVAHYLFYYVLQLYCYAYYLCYVICNFVFSHLCIIKIVTRNITK